ncbi:MAG TPA: hypothetical protein DEQ48_04795 [Helicobacter sp.]|nr:hypothetical protein [Helicobacter sp.]
MANFYRIILVAHHTAFVCHQRLEECNIVNIALFALCNFGLFIVKNLYNLLIFTHFIAHTKEVNHALTFVNLKERYTRDLSCFLQSHVNHLSNPHIHTHTHGLKDRISKHLGISLALFYSHTLKSRRNQRIEYAKTNDNKHK